VSVSGLIRGQQYPPMFENDRKRKDLLSATDRINDKFGEFTVSPGLVLMEKVLARERSSCHGFILKKGVVK